jgi:prostaglandin-H2 D-isomerase / glutathione transferase
MNCVPAALRSCVPMTRPIFTYFDFGGRAFAVRVALFKALGKDGWEDERIDGPTFARRKAAGELPLGALPMITLPDGLKVSQSTALARWAGRQSTLYPTDPTAALIVDFVMETANEILGKSPTSKDPDEKKKAREEYSQSGFMFRAMSALEARYDDASGFCTGSLTIADLVLYGFVDMVLTGNFDYVPSSYMLAH